MSSGDVENILMSTPVNLISLNKTGNRKRGRPKKKATATSESPEKKKQREDRAMDKKKDENVEKSEDTGGIEDEWGEEEVISVEQVTVNEPVSRMQWENETLLWIIDAQFSINLLMNNTDNEDINKLLHFFPPREYRLEGSEKIKARISRQATIWKNNGGMGDQKIVDAI